MTSPSQYKQTECLLKSQWLWNSGAGLCRGVDLRSAAPDTCGAKPARDCAEKMKAESFKPKLEVSSIWGSDEPRAEPRMDRRRRLCVWRAAWQHWFWKSCSRRIYTLPISAQSPSWQLTHVSPCTADIDTMVTLFLHGPPSWIKGERQFQLLVGRCRCLLSIVLWCGAPHQSSAPVVSVHTTTCAVGTPRCG